jgi:MFS family permease
MPFARARYKKSPVANCFLLVYSRRGNSTVEGSHLKDSVVVRQHREKGRLILSKSLTRTLYLLSILGFIIGIVLTVVTAGQTSTAADGTPTLSSTGAALGLVGIVLYIIAGILAFVAWIGALIKTAQLQRWGWFVCLIIFSGITMLIYIFAGPETAKEQVPARVG